MHSMSEMLPGHGHAHAAGAGALLGDELSTRSSTGVGLEPGEDRGEPFAMDRHARCHSARYRGFLRKYRAGSSQFSIQLSRTECHPSALRARASLQIAVQSELGAFFNLLWCKIPAAGLFPAVFPQWSTEGYPQGLPLHESLSSSQEQGPEVALMLQTFSDTCQRCDEKFPGVQASTKNRRKTPCQRAGKESEVAANNVPAGKRTGNSAASGQQTSASAVYAT